MLPTVSAAVPARSFRLRVPSPECGDGYGVGVAAAGDAGNRTDNGSGGDQFEVARRPRPITSSSKVMVNWTLVALVGVLSTSEIEAVGAVLSIV